MLYLSAPEVGSFEGTGKNVSNNFPEFMKLVSRSKFVGTLEITGGVK